jgi:hypothetical protein
MFVPNIEEKNEATVCPTGNLSGFFQRIGNQARRGRNQYGLILRSLAQQGSSKDGHKPQRVGPSFETRAKARSSG